MKKLYTYLLTGILFLFSLTISSQVLIPENFEGTSAAAPVPPGWTFTSSPPVASTTVTPCEGLRSVRALINSTNQNATLRSTIQVATGEDIEVSFAYKIIDESGGGATPATFGSIQLQYSVNANAATPVWANYAVIDGTNHNPSTNCAISTAIIPAASVPAGSNFAWRMRTNWATGAGSYYVYIDDFLAVELVDCIAPIYLNVINVTFDSAQIAWTDVNNPTPTAWEIEYGPVGFPPGFGFGTVVTTTINPATITNLDDGTAYDVYVRSVCGPGDVSNWAGPLNFQTIAIGTDCNTPKQVTSLPYVDSSDTNIYSNNYTGSPGTGCIGNNFLQGFDVVYRFDATVDNYLKIALSNLVGENNVGAFVYQSCAAIGSVCFAGSTTTTGSDFDFDIFVTSGQTYYIVLSTAGANTTTQYTLTITGFDCPSWNAPDGPSQIEFFGQQLSAFDNTGGPSGVYTTNDFATLNWYFDDNGAPGALIPDTNAITLVHGDIFWANQSLGTCQSPYLMVTFNEFDCLGQLAILTTNSGNEICDSGTTTLSATANTDKIFWYDNEFGGEVRGTGNTFVTDVINQTTSYWVAEAFVGQGNLSGQANPGPTTVATSTLNNYGVIVGNISSDFTLVSVQVFSTAGGGATTIELREMSGTLPVQTVTVSIPAGSTASPTPFTIPLNFELKSGTSYRLLKTIGPAMIISSAANSTFPYAVGNVAEVTNGSTATGTVTSYYYFYNWTITEDQPLCESPRTEVIAVVNEVFDVVATAVSSTACVNQNATLNVSSADPDYIYTWTWNNPAGQPQTANGAQIQPTIVQTTTFTVTGYNSITGCTSPPDMVTVEAIGAGEIPVTPEEVDACVGEIIELSAGGFYNTFNEQVTGWTVTNSSTGPGTPAAAAWKLVNSPYSPADGATSNDGSQFYIATADAVGPSGTVNTNLTSPSVNLVGVQNATLTFYHYYKHITTQATTARVQVSTNGGNTWTNLATYTANQGTATNFNLVTLNLSAYSGAADVRLRFNYTGSWGWWWAVDNVTVTRDYTNGQVTWSAIDNLFLDPAATVPYNGTSTNTVYFKSNTPGTFVYNVSLNITGCGTPVTNEVTINVFETLAPTGPALQDYITGQTLANLDVTGQNLKYYFFQNGQYVQISPNFLIQHGTTYYITQTLNNCESDFLEVTVNLDCPAPTNLAINVELGAGGTTAAGVITWTKPAVSTSIQGFYIEIRNAQGDLVFNTTTGATAEFAIVTGLPLDENYTVEIYSICDPTIPVYSATESETFNTFGLLSTSDFDFNGLTFYPNPTSNIVTFENLLPINNLEVFSMTGQKVIQMNQINANKVQVDFESLASGVYFTTLTVGESVQVVRIIRK